MKLGCNFVTGCPFAFISSQEILLGKLINKNLILVVYSVYSIKAFLYGTNPYASQQKYNLGIPCHLYIWRKIGLFSVCCFSHSYDVVFIEAYNNYNCLRLSSCVVGSGLIDRITKIKASPSNKNHIT